MAEYGGKPLPVAYTLDDAGGGPPQPDIIDSIVTGLKNSNQKVPDFSGVTLDSLIDGTRNLMPNVLLNAIDNFATPAGPDLSVPKNGGASGSFAKEGGQFNGTGATGSFAEGIGTIPISNVVGKGDDPALQLLTEQTQAEADALGAQGAAKAVKAGETAQAIDTKLQVRDHLANSKFNSELLNLIGPDRIVVSRMPKGSKLVAKTDDVMETVDPETGELIISVPQSSFQDAARVQQNDTKVAAQIVDSAKVTTRFDVDAEMAKLKTLKGADLTAAIGQLMTNIDLQAAKEYQRIRNQAAIESGYREAQASLERNLQLDITSGFTARHNTSSAQTQQAQRLLATALATSQALENSMTKADTEMARLASAKNSLLKVQIRREGREAKAESLRDTVTAQELTNYHFVYGNSGDDDKDRSTIVARRDKEPAIKKILQADSTNIFSLLTDSSPDIRNKAGKLVNEYDRAANGIAQGPEDTKLYSFIKPYINNPTQIIDDAARTLPQEKDNLGKLRIRMQTASSKTEIESIRQDLSNYLQRLVQKRYEDSYTNMKGWKADALNEGNPLRTIVDRVSKTNPTGAAPLETVVQSFIFEKIPGPDGKPMAYKDKVLILQNALRGTISNEFKSITMTDPEAIQLKIGQRINNIATSAAFASSLMGEGDNPFSLFGASF